jgi:two-component system sensor histidine kinase GlrK
MPSYRPRSIVSLVLVGFALVLTPFVIAVVTAVVQLDRFAVDSRAAVLNVGAATEESRALDEERTAIQRALGQYRVTGDSDYLDNYFGARQTFRATLEDLIALEVPGLDPAELQAIADDETSIFATLETDFDLLSEADWQGIDDSLASAASRSRAVRRASDELVQQHANTVTTQAELLQRTLLVIAAAAAPATVVLIVVFTVLITRPMRALGTAIRRLGAHALDQPIAVTGPRDIESLAGELEWLRRRIRALEEQKASFLQHISHELKTPLTTIREGSELLTETLGDDSAEEAEIARLLRENSLQLQRLIEDLLQFAMTQDLALDLEFESAVDLAAVIDESVAALVVVSDAKDVAIETSLNPVGVCCDAEKMRTVVDNLLTNAIKYTPHYGRIDVGLTARDTVAVIDVSDSGPGVDAADRQRIFEPFGQGSAAYESSVKGTGLGLSIAREYVEAHSGTIELLDSERGAHFRVVLPIAGPADVAAR